MIFAESDAQFLWTQFGFAGLLLFALTFLAGYLFKLWLKSKEHDHQQVLDIQRQTQIETLKALNKRDEIRFTAYHAERIKRIETIYSDLVDLRSSAYKDTPAEMLKKFTSSWDHMVKSRIYFGAVLAANIESSFRVFEELYEMKQTQETMKDTLRTAPAEAMRLIKEKREIFDQKLPQLFKELEGEARKIFGADS